MNTKIILISLAILSILSKVSGQTQQADCNNLYLDTVTFYISPQQDTIVSGNLFYMDTTFSVYPALHLILSDTSIITSPDVMWLSFLDSGSIQPFEFRINFKTTTFPNNTMVNGLFHIYDSDSPGDSTVTCYFPITIILQNTTGINDNVVKNNEFTIYPNPFSFSTTLQADKIFKDATLTVYNSYGQTLKQIKNISEQTIILHRDNLPSGLYFIRLTENNNNFVTNKLVITD